MACLFCIGLSASALTQTQQPDSQQPDSQRPVFNNQAITDSGDVWENSVPGVQYIGTAKCVECHRDQHASYLKTTHSVATVKTDAAGEPAPASFFHEPSLARYEVEHRGSDLLHREIRLDGQGKQLAVTDRAMQLTVGSGQHGRSYLYRVGPFFGQSPVTWYQDTDKWRMSPGFDRPFHSSFRRKIESGCVFCHVGSIDAQEGNPYRFEIAETTIGCERCHGPGELHAKRYHEDPTFTGVDRTIVNPDALPRELAEAVCQQCHLQGVTEVVTSGHEFWDFRPGRPLTDFRVDFQFSQHDRMMIVGHVEQMHASKCYTETETLTCTTCHDPHNPVERTARVDFYRRTCLECHADGDCGETLEHRMDQADNSCYQCHMPKADTNVAHAAFHHHRIGIHHSDPESAVIADSKQSLVPLLDVSHLSQRERDRCEALAKVILLRDDPGNPSYNEYGLEATETLIKLKQSGPVDAPTDNAIAFLASAQNQRAIAESLAKEAISKQPRPTIAHIQATSLLAQMAFQQGQKERAVDLYRKVNQYHRDARDMFFLGLCENNVGNVDAGIAALEKSLEIDPMQFGPHSALQAIYQATGRPDKASFHARQGQRISEVNALIKKNAEAN